MTTKGRNHHKRCLGYKDPRVTSSQTFNFHESSWRAQIDAQCNGKSTSAQILHSQIPPKATNAYGGRGEEEQTKTQQMELQDLGPKGSPHLEERLIGGNIDLDLLSLFSLKDMQESWEGLRDGQSFQGQQWQEREGKTCSRG